MFVTAKVAAYTLATRTGMRGVAPSDVRELAEHGYLRPRVGGRHSLFDTAELNRFTAVEELRRVGDARRAWLAASMDRWDAAEALGLCLDEFDVVAASRGLQPGRF